MNKSLSLTPQVKNILHHQGTEPPHTGQYNVFEGKGTYLCRQCGLALFRSSHKFLSSCGWPSFDDELPGRIQRKPDADGRRTEIVCARCEGHLGHVFSGEQLTEKNLRHCVNSASVDFVPDCEVEDTEEAIFAGGCFWGVQYYLNKQPGVLLTEVGYMGGAKENPTYEEVCTKTTGHVEAIRVLFDPKRVDYETLTKLFLEIHDPTQADGQGPDIGPQYLSVIFYYPNTQQKQIAEQLLTILKNKGLEVVTELKPVSSFWPAEAYHQHYYDQQGSLPYCHARTRRF